VKEISSEGEGVKTICWNRGWLFGLFLVAATFIAYAPVWHAGYIWDDDRYVTGNVLLHSADGLRQIWFAPGATSQFYPLTYSVFWIEYHFWQLNPLGYHVVNVALHSLNAILLWRLLRRLGVRGAWLAGAIFALHPVNVMSVAWVTELKNTLSGGLALCAAHAYVRFAGLGIDTGKENPARWRFYVLALAFFQLAMFAKTAVSFVPLTLFLIVWWQKEKISWRDALPLLPMLAISVLMGKLTIFMEHKYAGATGAGFNLDLAQRIYVSGHSFWFYIGKLIFPFPLIEVYERWKIISIPWTGYIYAVAMLALLVGLWIARGRIGKGAFAAAMHFYIATSLFVLMVVLYFMRYSFVSDHWQYFGCMSAFAVAAAGLTTWLDRFGKRKFIFYGVLFLLLGFLTWQQAEIYRSAETLWRATLAGNPDCAIAHNDLGYVLLQDGKIDEALDNLQKAVLLQPDDASAQKNLGGAFLEKGQVDEAIIYFRSALELDNNDVGAHNNLGFALFKKGRLNDAIAEYEKALEIQPDDAGVHHNFGLALFKEGLVDKALVHYRKSLKIHPADAEVENDIANALSKSGSEAEAIQHWQKALEIRPQYMPAQNNLAWALATCPDASLRNGAKAVQLAQQADQISGGKNLLILRTLAAAYAEAGQFTNALATAGQALQLAAAGHNVSMINSLQEQIKLYENGQPLHAPAD
jgi:tetratricopeptide (TPR) repeat protein